jgi:16S rRNA (guanine527-N7)-methyltransferase
MSSFGPLLRHRIEERGLGVEATAVDRLARYLQLVESANARVNLVSRASAAAEELVERHLLDSLLALPLLPPPAGRRRLLDIGSGGGFPAIPLLIARPDLDGTLVEATGKKARFLQEVIRELDLTARVLNARFPAPQMTEQTRFDLLTSRAVADAGALVRQAAPFLSARAVAILWTTEPLLDGIRRRTGIQSLRFHRSPGAQLRGLAVLECST